MCKRVSRIAAVVATAAAAALAVYALRPTPASAPTAGAAANRPRKSARRSFGAPCISFATGPGPRGEPDRVGGLARTGIPSADYGRADRRKRRAYLGLRNPKRACDPRKRFTLHLDAWRPGEHAYKRQHCIPSTTPPTTRTSGSTPSTTTRPTTRTSGSHAGKPVTRSSGSEDGHGGD